MCKKIRCIKAHRKKRKTDIDKNFPLPFHLYFSKDEKWLRVQFPFSFPYTIKKSALGKYLEYGDF